MSEDQKNKEVHPLISIFVGVLIGMAVVALMIGLSSCGGKSARQTDVGGRYRVTIANDAENIDLGGTMVLSQTDHVVDADADVVGDFMLAKGEWIYVGTVSGKAFESGSVNLTMLVPGFTPFGVLGRLSGDILTATANDSGFENAKFSANLYNKSSLPRASFVEAGSLPPPMNDHYDPIDLVIRLPDGSYAWNRF